MLDKKIKRRKT